jgi:hypothetical protein
MHGVHPGVGPPSDPLQHVRDIWSTGMRHLGVGISIPYLVVTAYLSIATSHHSFTLVLLSDILSILQVMSPA